MSSPEFQKPLAMHNVYFGLALVFGLVLAIVTPAFQVPDELNHFYRCYQLSEGGLIGQKQGATSGGIIPASLPATTELITRGNAILPRKYEAHDILKALAIPLERSSTTFVEFSNTVLYSPVVYLPQLIGISLGKLFDASPLILLYLGRIFNCLFGALVCRQAIKIAPVHQNTLALVALMPMSIYLFASLSPDPVAIGFCFLFLAQILKTRTDRAITNQQEIGLLVLAALIGLSKAAYAPVSLCAFLLVDLPGRSQRRNLVLCAGIVGASFVTDLLWTRATAGSFTPVHPSLITPQQAGNFVLAHPVTFVAMVLGNLVSYGWFYLESLVGVLGWLNLPLGDIFVLLYLAVLLGTAVIGDHQQVPLGWKPRFLLGGTGIAITLLLVASQFFVWTRVGSSKIGMAQGRYFIPIAPLLLLSAQGLIRLPKLGRALDKLLPYFLLGSLSYTVIAVVEHYY